MAKDVPRSTIEVDLVLPIVNAKRRGACDGCVEGLSVEK